MCWIPSIAQRRAVSFAVSFAVRCLNAQNEAMHEHVYDSQCSKWSVFHSAHKHIYGYNNMCVGRTGLSDAHLVAASSFSSRWFSLNMASSLALLLACWAFICKYSFSFSWRKINVKKQTKKQWKEQQLGTNGSCFFKPLLTPNMGFSIYCSLYKTEND